MLQGGDHFGFSPPLSLLTPTQRNLRQGWKLLPWPMNQKSLKHLDVINL